MAKSTLTLSGGWRWRLSNAHGISQAEALPGLKQWTPVSSFPSVIQMELLHRKLIPDPNIGENERDMQWAGEVDWDYQCQFQTPGNVLDKLHADLHFEGLDTFATVYLNGKVLFENDNMFIPRRVGVRSLLKPAGEPNALLVAFKSASRVSTRLEKTYGARTSFMRDKRRMHIRKAQASASSIADSAVVSRGRYHWGWDWGPIVLTAGPYMPVHLEAYNSRIDNVHVVPKPSIDHQSATIEFEVSLAGSGGASRMNIAILDPAGTTVGSSSLLVDGGQTKNTGSIHVSQPRLWWPNGQGQQPLYTAVFSLLDKDGQLLDTTRTSFGIRSIELVQRPLASAPGTTFMFRVNGRDIFVQGGDWIPADMLLPTITRQRYFDWIQMARDCHINMIRIWGGGIYESEDLFDACDQMGILVWHDYAFACGDYPVHDEFMAGIAKEVEAQTLRLRNRASLALLCGGNEDFMFADNFLKIDYDRADVTGPFDGKPFPQRKIYLDVIPKIAQSLAPETAYWANSPYGGADANDPHVGDIHQWEVWHGQQLPYQQYSALGGRFVSEFGMHGFPVARTLAYLCQGAPAGALHPQSRLIDCHNKGHGAHTRIARYLAENVRYDMTSLRNAVYASQLMQSEAYVCALQGWKRQFGGPGQEACAGAIIWQLNDVYPGTSWSFVDYFLRPKPAYYAIKRAFAPLSVGVKRSVASRWVDEDKPQLSQGPPSFALWAHNTTPEPVGASLELAAYDFTADVWLALPQAEQKQAVSLPAGRSTELGELKAPADWPKDIVVILEARLVDPQSGKQLARYVDWPEPYRYLVWPDDTRIAIKVEKTDGEQWENRVAVSSKQALKGVWLEPVYNGTEKDDSKEPVWEDNMFDLLPAHPISVGVNGLEGRDVCGRFLADWEVGKKTA